MKQLSLFPELDLSSDEPLQVNPTTNEIFNKFVEKKKESPVRKPNAVPPKTTTIQKYKNCGAAAPKPNPKPLNILVAVPGASPGTTGRSISIGSGRTVWPVSRLSLFAR